MKLTKNLQECLRFRSEAQPCCLQPVWNGREARLPRANTRRGHELIGTLDADLRAGIQEKYRSNSCQVLVNRITAEVGTSHNLSGFPNLPGAIAKFGSKGKTRMLKRSLLEGALYGHDSATCRVQAFH